MEFRAHPNTEISKFINVYKSASSRLIKKEFTNIPDKLENRQFWSKTFCLFTLANDEEDIVGDYIKKQVATINK